jgi:hypothetical protein
VPAVEASPPSDAVGPSALVGLGEFKLPALEDALDGCTTPDQLREYLGKAETWLARLRRNQPDQAREADAMVSAAWERVRAAALPEWAIVGSGGDVTEYRTADEWLDHWRHRVDGIETAEFPIAARRRALERLLEANAEVLRRMEKRGSIAASLDATAAAAQADGRLAAQEQGGAVGPALRLSLGRRCLPRLHPRPGRCPLGRH